VSRILLSADGAHVRNALQAPGVYGGRDVIIMTTDFGVRR